MAKTGQTGLHRYRSDLLAALKRDVDQLADESTEKEGSSDDALRTAQPSAAEELPPMRRAEDREIFGSDPYLSALTRASKDRA